VQRILGQHAAVYVRRRGLRQRIVGVSAFKSRGYAGGPQKGIEIWRFAETFGCGVRLGVVGADYGTKTGCGRRSFQR
jgi:hypothetical protein